MRPEQAPTPAPPAPSRPLSAGGALALAMAIGALAAFAYVALPQHVGHQYDLYWMLPRLLDGPLDYPRHPLAFPFLDAVARWLAPFGGSLHERLQATSGLCTGLAVGIYTHAAWRLGRERWFAAWTGVLFACLPSVVHFATVFELHGPFLPFAALATWCTGALVLAPTHRQPLLVVPVGLCTALASTMHATGHLLLGCFAIWICVEQRRAGCSLRRRLLGVAILLAVHMAGVVAIAWLVLEGPGAAPTSEQAAFLLTGRFSAVDLHRVITAEWIVPFLPASLLWLPGWPRRHPGLAWALAVAVPVYLAVCQVLFVVPGEGYVLHERGAYLLPLAFGAVVLTTAALRTRGRLFVLLVAVGVATWQWRHPPAASPDAAFGQAAARYLRTHEHRLFVGGTDELGGVFDAIVDDAVLRRRLTEVFSVDQFVWYTRENGATTADQLGLALHPRLVGKPTVITAAALAGLRARNGIHRELVDRVLPAFFTLVPLEPGDGGLQAYRLDVR